MANVWLWGGHPFLPSRLGASLHMTPNGQSLPSVQGPLVVVVVGCLWVQGGT